MPKNWFPVHFFVDKAKHPSRYDLASGKWFVHQCDGSGQSIRETVEWILLARQTADQINVSFIKQVVFSDAVNTMEIENSLDSTGAILIDYCGKTFDQALADMHAEVVQTQRLIEEQRAWQNV